MVSSTVSRNEARLGGGVYSAGKESNQDTKGDARITIENSTISSNQSLVRQYPLSDSSIQDAYGGGIGAIGRADISLYHSTVTENGVVDTDGEGGGGIFFPNGGASNTQGTLTIDHSVVAGNFANSTFDSLSQETHLSDGLPPVNAYNFSDVTFGNTEANLVLKNSLLGSREGINVYYYAQSPLIDLDTGLPQKWEDGGRPAAGEHGNYIGGPLIGQDHNDSNARFNNAFYNGQQFYGGYLYPVLDVLASNGGPTKTHAPLLESRAPLALIVPSGMSYTGPMGVGGYDENQIIADPIVGFDSLENAAVLTLPYLHNELLLQQAIRNKSWLTKDANTNPSFDFTLPSQADITQFITWGALDGTYSDNATQVPYSSNNEAKSFELHFFLNGAMNPHDSVTISERALPPTNNFDDPRGYSQVFDLGRTIRADRVIVTITDNFGGNRYTLGQMRFVGGLLNISGNSLISTASPVIDAGIENFDINGSDGDAGTDDDVPYDQRGEDYDRINGNKIDIGAHESGSHPTDVGPPMVELELVTDTLPENVDTTNGLKIADVIVSKHKSAPLEFQISGDDGHLFEIKQDEFGRSTRELWLKPGAVLNYEQLANGMPDVDVQVTDNTLDGTSDPAELIGLMVQDKNDRPYLTGDVPSITLARDATPETNLGVSVVSLLRDATDEDLDPAPDELGMAITALSMDEAPNSTVEYSLDHGESWYVLEQVIEGDAMLLPATALLRFNLQDFISTRLADVIEFRVWDQTLGSVGALQRVDEVEGSLSQPAEGEGPLLIDVVISPRIGNPQVLEPNTDNENYGNQIQPTVAVDARGISTHVWKDERGLVAARFNSEGVVLGDTILVTTIASASTPEIVVTSDGGSIVVWTQEVGSERRLFARQLAPPGTNFPTLSDALELDPTGTSAAGTDSLFSVALVEEDDSFLVLMQRDKLYLSRHKINTAGDQANRIGNSLDLTTGLVRDATSTISLDGAAVQVAWANANNEIVTAKYSTALTALEVEATASTYGGFQPPDGVSGSSRTISDLVVAQDSSGEVVIGWMDTTNWQFSNFQMVGAESRLYAIRSFEQEWRNLDQSSLQVGHEPKPLDTANAFDSQGEYLFSFGLADDYSGQIGLAWTKLNTSSPANTQLVTKWLTSANSTEELSESFVQFVPGVWSTSQLNSNDAGHFVLTGQQDFNGASTVVAQRYSLSAVDAVEVGIADQGEGNVATISNTLNSAARIEVSKSTYAGTDYLAINGQLTDIEVGGEMTLQILGGSASAGEVIDLRSPTLADMQIIVDSGDGDDQIYVGAGDNISIQGGLGDDTYHLSNKYETALHLSDLGGDDQILLQDWQGADGALVVLGYEHAQTITQGTGSNTIDLTLAEGTTIETVIDDGSNSNHVIFSSSAKPQSLVVDTLADELDLTGNSTGLSLREALLWAKTDPQVDTITFDSAVFTGTQTITLSDELVIDTAVSIAGPNGSGDYLTIGRDTESTIEHRIFHITHVAGATLKDLTLTGGSAPIGGAILAEGDLRLLGVTVEYSLATGVGGQGGGIAVRTNGSGSQPTLHVINSIVQNNQAVEGAGIYLAASATLIDSSTILNNGVDPGSYTGATHGGGIFMRLGAELEVTNSTIAKNEARSGDGVTGSGGGIYSFVVADDVVSLASVTFADNKADAGGALYRIGGNVEAHGVLFSRNTKHVDNTPNSVGGTNVFDTVSSYNYVDAGGAGNLPLGQGNNSIAGSGLIEDTITTPSGETPYYALASASAAKDKIPAANFGQGTNIPHLDQLGNVPDSSIENPIKRDIGAVEYNGAEDTTTASLPAVEAHILEDIKSGDRVLTVQAEPSWRLFTYALVDHEAGVFAIDPDTGVVSVADDAQIDAELTPGYLLNVAASEINNTDAPPIYGVARIIVDDVNEAPQAFGPFNFQVSEHAVNGDLVSTVSGDDPEGNALTYELASTSSVFDIDANTGQITVADAAKLADKSAFDLQVKIEDTSSSVIANVHIDVLAAAPVELTEPTALQTDYTVSHSGELVINPAASFVNLKGSNYKVVYRSGSKSLTVEHLRGAKVDTPSGSLNLSLGNLSVRDDGSLLFNPKDNLVTKNRLKSFSADDQHYYEIQNFSFEVIDLDTGEKLHEKENFSVKVTNSLPVFRSEYMSYQNSKEENVTTYVLEDRIRVNRDKTYRINVNEIFYDPDGDPITIEKLTNVGPRGLDDPEFDENGSIQAVFGEKTNGGSFFFPRTLYIDKDAGSNLNIHHDGEFSDHTNPSSFSDLGFPSRFEFAIDVSDGQRNRKKEKVGPTFEINVAPWNGTAAEDETLVPWLETREHIYDSPALFSEEWTLTASALQAGRDGVDFQVVGDTDVDLIHGTLQRRHALVLDRSGGNSEAALPGLIYDSATADPRPVIEVTLDPPNDFDVESDDFHSITARFTWYDHIKTIDVGGTATPRKLVSEVHYTDINDLDNPGSNAWKFQFQPPEAPIYSGVYHWEVEFEINSHDPENLPSSDYETLRIKQSGDTAVVANKKVEISDFAGGPAARNYTPRFGDGWALEGVPQLFVDYYRGVDNLSGEDFALDDAYLLWFPGESPRVFERAFQGFDLFDGEIYADKFSPLDLSTGLEDPNEFGTLTSRTVQLKGESSDTEAIVYESQAGTSYIFTEAPGESSSPAPNWVLREIYTPTVGLQLNYNGTQLTGIVSADGQTTTFGQDETNFGYPTANGQSVSFELDAQHRLEKIEHQLFQLASRTRMFDYGSGSSRLTNDSWHIGSSSTQQRVTSFEYDPTRHFLTDITYGSGSGATEYTLSPAIEDGLFKLTLQTDGIWKDTFANAPKQVTWLDDSVPEEERIVSRVATVQLATNIPGGNWLTEYTFDADNNLSEREELFGTSLSNSTSLTSEAWSYDALGAAISYTDPLNRVTYFTYDYHTPVHPTLVGELTDQQTPNSHAAQYDENDFRGNVVRIDDFAGTTRFVYETADKAKRAHGQLVQVTDPWGLVTQYDLNERGQVTELRRGADYVEKWEHHPSTGSHAWLVETHTSPLGLTTTYTYDNSRRVDSAKVVDDGANGETTFTEYSYDANGYLNLVTLNAGATAGAPDVSRTDYDYDESGLLRSLVVKNGDDDAVSSQAFDYAPDGLLTRESYGASSDSTVTEYVYDERGLLTKRRHDRNRTSATEDWIETNYTYYTDGRLKETELPDDTKITESYDPVNFTQTTKTENVATHSSYDTPLDVTVSEETTREQTFDKLGRLVMDSNPLTGALTTYAYHDVRFDLPTNVVETVNLDGGATGDDKLNTYFAYDQQGNAVYEKLPGQAARTSKFNRLGFLTETQVLTGHGGKFVYTHDAVGNVTKQTEYRRAAGEEFPEIGIETDYVYDEQGRLRRIKDTADRDANGNEVTSTGAIDYAFGQIDGSGPHYRTITNTSREGVTTKQYLNAVDQVLRDENVFGGATDYGYDQAGNLKSVTERNPNAAFVDRVFEYSYDGLDRITESIERGVSTMSNNLTTTTEYNDTDANGWDVTVTDPENVVTRSRFDSLGNLVAVREGQSTAQPADNPDQLTLVSYAYDATSRSTTVTTRTTSPRAEANQAAHDETTVNRQVVNTLGDVLEVYARTSDLDVADTSSTGFELRQAMTYAAAGLVTTSTDGKGKTTSFGYDQGGSGLPLLTSETSEQQLTEYTYDSAGNRRTRKQNFVSNNGGSETTIDNGVTWTYDDLGRVTKEEVTIDNPDYESAPDPETIEVSRNWRYDGLTTVYTDRNGVNQTSIFTPGVNTTQVTNVWTTNESNPEYTSTLTYNKDGSLQQAADSWLTGDKTGDSSSVTFTYDEFGRSELTTSSHTFNGISSTSTVDVSEYHGNGVRKTATIAIAGTDIVENGYEIDDRGRVKELTQFVSAAPHIWLGEGKTITLQHNSNGQRKRLDRFDTHNPGPSTISISHTDYAYQDDGGLREVSHRRQIGTDSSHLIAQHVFGYDANGLIDAVGSAYRDSDATATLLHDTRHTHVYNGRGNLVATNADVSGNLSDATPGHIASREVDSGSNARVAGATYGNQNRLLSDAKDTYTYDHEGRLTEIDVKANSGVQTFDWDHRGLLVSSVTAGATGLADATIDFHYDVLGRKVARRIVDPANSANSTEHTVYVWDGRDLAFELDALAGPQEITRGYFNGSGVNEVLAVDGVAGFDTVWQFADQVGTVRTVGTYEGSDTWKLMHRSLDSFGQQNTFYNTTDEILGDTTEADLLASPIIFAGHQFDAGVGLYDMRARWYDALHGRMVSEDPLGEAGGSSNLYIYAGGDPINNIDPDGEAIFTVAALTAAGVYFGTQGGFSAAETAVEYAAIRTFGTQDEIDNFSFVATFGKNFGINVVTGGLGKAKTLGRVGAFVGRQAVEIGGDTAFDVTFNGRDFGSALTTNAIGSVIGEGIGTAIGSGVRAFNRNFEIAVNNSTAYAGLPLNAVKLIRRASSDPDANSQAILRTQKELSILANRQAEVVDRFLRTSDSRLARKFRNDEVNDPNFAQLIRGRVLDIRLRGILQRNFRREIREGLVQIDRTVPETGTRLRPDILFRNLGGQSVLFDFGSVSKLDEINKFEDFAELVIPIVPVNRF